MRAQLCPSPLKGLKLSILKSLNNSMLAAVHGMSCSNAVPHNARAMHKSITRRPRKLCWRACPRVSVVPYSWSLIWIPRLSDNTLYLPSSVKIVRTRFHCMCKRICVSSRTHPYTKYAHYSKYRLVYHFVKRTK